MKKALSIVLLLVMIMTMLPTFAITALAEEDTRTPVDCLEFSGFVAPKYGENIANAALNITKNYTTPEGAVYYLARNMSNISKFIDGRWRIIDRNYGDYAANYQEYLNEGKYQFSVQVRIDDENGLLYNFASTIKDCTVNGQPSEFSLGGNFSGYSYGYITFDFDIEKEALPFEFADSATYDYNSAYVNTPITEKRLQAIGGTESYVFSKVSTDCEWLNVSSDGIISGTPTKTDNQTYNIEIKCTDGVDEATVTIFVGKVFIAPEDRVVIDTIELTGFTAPAYGEKMTNTIAAIMGEAQCPEGVPYYISKRMNSVFKSVNGTWVHVDRNYGSEAANYLDSYNEGNYLIRVQVRIDGTEGYDYVFSDTLNSCTINGESSDYSLGYIQNTYSYYTVDFEFEVTCEHNYETTITKKPTCSAWGEKICTCTICGDTYTVNGDNFRNYDESEWEGVFNLGHTGYNDLSETTIITEPTCSALGECTWKCTRCGIDQYDLIVKDLNNHNYKTATTGATTSADGKVVTKCTACGKIQSTTVINKIGKVTLGTTKYTYDGKAKKPAVTVKDSKGNKISSSNYTVKYSNNTKVGKATVTITFKGNYKGTIKKTFKINPKGTSIASLTAASKGFTVKWKKQATQTTGYQIQIATDSKFTKGVKNYTVSKNSTVSKKITKLTGKKKYYVRIRTYKTVSGTKYYSSWSAKKYVTTKK